MVVLTLELARIRNGKVVGSAPIIGISNLYIIDSINFKFIQSEIA